MSNTLKTRIVIRNDIAANWTAANPILLKGELGLETDTNKFKIGDGTTAWNALPYSPEIDASAVTLTKDITATYAFGKYSPDSTGSVTIPAEGKTLEEFLQNALAQEKDPAITRPTCGITLTGAGAKEAGTRVTPAYTTSFNKGKYSYGPDTGIAPTSYSVTESGRTGQEAQTGSTGSFAEIQVTDGLNYKLNLTTNYSKGADPKTNLGTAKPALAIAAGSCSATSAIITSYRNSFYGTLTSKAGELDNATIRGLSGKSGKTLGAGSVFNVSIPVGALRVVIAVPAERTIKTVNDVNGLNATIEGAFKKVVVSVEGANGYAAKDYNVYYTDYASANDKANTYKVTLA